MTQFDARTQQVFAVAVAKALRDSRRRQQLTQEEVALRTNGLVTESALAHFESAHQRLPVEVLWVLAAALGMDIAALVRVAQRSADLAGTELSPVPAEQEENVN